MTPAIQQSVIKEKRTKNKRILKCVSYVLSKSIRNA